MAQTWRVQETMLQAVAVALGPLRREVAFVGGCTTALLLTDAVSREAVRFTDDVDVIVHVLGAGGWYVLQEQLLARGFRFVPEDVVCRLRLPTVAGRELIVDFMPDDAAVLGFSNRWYAEALRTAADHALPDGTVIRVVSSVCFVGTKLVAWRGRGNDDPLGSRDVEDLVHIVDGREGLVQEIAGAAADLRDYIAAEMAALLRHPGFEYVVQSASFNSVEREALIFSRLEAIAAL